MFYFSIIKTKVQEIVFGNKIRILYNKKAPSEEGAVKNVR